MLFLVNRIYVYTVNFESPAAKIYILPMTYIFMFYRVTSVWENSLQITTISSFVGSWLGAFPIPLDWERPWQVGFCYLKQQNKYLYNDSKTNEAN